MSAIAGINLLLIYAIIKNLNECFLFLLISSVDVLPAKIGIENLVIITSFVFNFSIHY